MREQTQTGCLKAVVSVTSIEGRWPIASDGWRERNQAIGRIPLGGPQVWDIAMSFTKTQ